MPVGATLTTVVDTAARDRGGSIAAPGGGKAADLRRARRPVEHPRAAHRRASLRRPGPPRPRQSVSRALVQRPHPHRFRRDPRPSRASTGADWGTLPDRRGARLLFSNDRRAQGVGGLWLSGAPLGDRRVRPDPSQSGLAVDRELLSGRYRDFPHPRLPRHCSAARGHERGAVRVAQRLGDPARRHQSDPRLREQRQGNL